jgi:hypothetical protein
MNDVLAEHCVHWKEASNDQIALRRLTSFACRGGQELFALRTSENALDLILRKHSQDAKIESCKQMAGSTGAQSHRSQSSAGVV